MSTHDDLDRVREELRITCADATDLATELREGTLVDGDEGRVRDHLAGCEACAVWVAQVDRAAELAARTRPRDTDVPAGDLERLMEAWRQR